MSDMEKQAKGLLDEGIRLAKAGKRDDAVQCFLKLVSTFPGAQVADNAYYNLGQIYVKQGEHAKAYATFRTVVEQYPDSDAAGFAADQLEELKNLADPASALFERAQQAYIQGDLAEARKLFTNLITESPDSVLADNAYFSLGMLGRRLGDRALAEASFRVVREKYPESDAARLLAAMESQGRT